VKLFFSIGVVGRGIAGSNHGQEEGIYAVNENFTLFVQATNTSHEIKVPIINKIMSIKNFKNR